MLKKFNYEQFIIRTVIAMIIAVFVVMGILFLLELKFSNCNFKIFLMGVGTLTVIFLLAINDAN